MNRLPKHSDLFLLGGIVLLALLGVVMYDSKDLTARDDVATLNGEGALYEAKSPVKSLENKQPVKQVAVLEAGIQHPANSSIPRPFEKGVIHLGEGAALGGILPFPEDNAWNQRIDDLPVDPLSDVIINTIGRERNIHPDFGSGLWNGAPIGIPYVVVSGDQKRYPIRYTAYGDESDPGPYPVPTSAPIEGDPNVDGDRHVIVVDRDNWTLYELFRAFPVAGGLVWKAESGAIFNMKEHPSRPIGWTSADAAGLPIFPGLVRYDETVELKEIRHALRFTVQKTRRAFVPPATHWASRHTSLDLPPLGMRVRLKKDFDISSFPAEAQVILTALKRYGMILADNGSDWFISGAPHPLWNDDNLHKLKKVHGGDFEVVLMEGLVEDQ